MRIISTLVLLVGGTIILSSKSPEGVSLGMAIVILSVFIKCNTKEVKK